jgi:hypothetical protein
MSDFPWKRYGNSLDIPWNFLGNSLERNHLHHLSHQFPLINLIFLYIFNKYLHHLSHQFPKYLAYLLIIPKITTSTEATSVYLAPPKPPLPPVFIKKIRFPPEPPVFALFI